MDKTREDNTLLRRCIFSLNQEQSHKKVRNSSENTDQRKIHLKLEVSSLVTRLLRQAIGETSKIITGKLIHFFSQFCKLIRFVSNAADSWVQFKYCKRSLTGKAAVRDEVTFIENEDRSTYNYKHTVFPQHLRHAYYIQLTCKPVT